MFFKKCILTVVLCLSVHLVFAQLNPWWVDEPVIDSAEIKAVAISDSVIDYAKTFMGVPYQWGGNDPDSGFRYGC